MKKTKILKNFFGLEYVTIQNVPIRRGPQGETIIDMSLHELERRVSVALIEQQVPIRGRELRLIKSALGLSFVELGQFMRTTDKTVKNWARKLDERLAPGPEVLFRLLAAEKLGVLIQPTVAGVIAKDKVSRIRVNAA